MHKDTGDYALNWFYNQANSRDLHALTLDTFKYIYCEKVLIYLPTCLCLLNVYIYRVFLSCVCL